MRHRARSATGALACCTVLLAACGGAEEAPSAAAQAAPAVTTRVPAPDESPTTVPPPTGPPPSFTAPASTLASQVSGVPETPSALRFTAPLVGGGEIDLAGYAGQPVLFWFWAPY
jgi:hypothetical protein